MQAQILVPLDGSARAAGALPQAQAVAAATGRGLTLVLVVPTPIIINQAMFMGLAAEQAAERQAVDIEVGTGYLQGVAARLSGPVHTAVLQGDPALAIVEYALQHPPVELIAMATHGRTGLGRWVLGSVAEAVLYATPVPLLLIRPTSDLPADGPAPTYRTILVPLDGSAFAEQALDPACALAAATGATLVLLAADEPMDAPAGTRGDVPLWFAQDRQNAVLHLEEYLRATTARLASTGIPIKTDLVPGPPAPAILEAGVRRQSDLIVMATHGRQGFQQFRLGSVALKVVQSATQPVLLYPPRAVPARQAEPAADKADRIPAGVAAPVSA